jgi:hypothetical protein
MDFMKKYQHATKNELDTLLFRAGEIKRQPERFTEIRDVDGNIVDPSEIKRTNELTGAGLEYLTSLGEYLFTHHKKMFDNKQQHYFTSAPIDWSAAIDIATGGIAGQRKRAEIAIMHWHAKPKPTLIIAQDGQRYSMLPFVIVFNWGRPEELDAKAAARLARIKKNDDQELFPIKSITIMFAKPLFEDYFRKSAGTYSFPAGMYAKMFKEANNVKKLIAKNEDEVFSQKEKRELDSIDHDTYVSAYTRFARYVIRHNNLTGKEMKDKKHHSPITIEIIPFLLEVYPRAVGKNGRGEIHFNQKEFRHFLGQAIALYHVIPDFLFYPVLERTTDTKFTLEIYTCQQAAWEAQKKILDPQSG